MNALRGILFCTAPGLQLLLAANIAGAVDLRSEGAFGFPQQYANVVCDRPDLRFSVWNNGEYLFAQAVLWGDNDSAIGKTVDNREIGDRSTLMLDLDGDGAATGKVDRNYSLNPWPRMQGLHYQIILSESASSGLEADSRGRGATRYIKLADGKQARVDTYLLPLPELGRKAGDRIRLCYFGASPQPALIVNSAGYHRDGKQYYSHHIPRTSYHDYVLIAGSDIDISRAPEGRDDIPLPTKKRAPVPAAGQAPPEIHAAKWINLNQPASLKSLSGRVVVIEFWATWCGPCIAAIPKLNQLHAKYGGKDFQLISLVAEGHATMDRFLSRTTVKYPIGLESTSLDDYGIEGIPHAFVIGRNGKVAWHGHSSSDELENAIATELRRSE